MRSLLDPKSEEEESDEPEERWYAIIIYDDGSGIWHASDHPTEDEAMVVLREKVFNCIGGNDANVQDEIDTGDDDYWTRIHAEYRRWSLDTMNGYLNCEGDGNTVFCKKGGTE